MRNLRFVSTLVALFACAGSLAAGEAVGWTNVAVRSAKWLTAGNWTNAIGQVLSSAPTNGEDLIFADVPELPVHNAYTNDNALLGEQSVSYDETGTYSLQMGAVTGDARHTLVIDTDGDANSFAYERYSRSVSIGDPTGFLGFWLFGSMELAVSTPASATLTPVFHNLSAKHNPVLTVTNAAGTAVIDSLYDVGAIAKAGAGALRVKATSGAQTVVYLKEGKLILDGRADGSLSNLFDRAALHLDASVTDSLVRETGADGLVSVLEWKDVRGKADALSFKWRLPPSPGYWMIQNSNPPFLAVAAQSPTGLPLVDFGARSYCGDAEYPERGRTNCYMQLADAAGNWVDLTNVREVFYAVAAPKSSDNVQILGGTSRINYMCSGGTELFNSTYSDPAVRHGDLIFNMQRHTHNNFTVQQLTDLYTLGVGVGRDTMVSYLGTRQLYANCTGGSRMGEILLFTNDLTRAERLAVCGYLDAKWRTGETSQDDLTALHVGSASAVLEIPDADKTVRIGSLTVPGKSFTKTGDGTLVVGQVTSGTTIDVQGGKVVFASPTLTDTAVAAEPYVHLDAASIGADDVEVVDGVSYVNTWKDETYGAARQATAALSGTSRPTLVANAWAGKAIVDFGARDKTGGTGAWMKLCNWGVYSSHQAYAGFIVLRYKELKSSAPHFGSSVGMTFYRDSAADILSTSYKNARMGAALWRVSGSVESPFASAGLNQTTNFVVLSFSSGYPVQLDAIAADKGGQKTVLDSGGIEVGELVVYDRQLTTAEIQSTEAFLMKKWLVNTAPGGTSVAEVTQDDDQPVGLANNCDLTIGRLTGGNGAVVKEGSGAATIKSFSVQPTSLAVRDGSLTVCVSGETFLDEALFHLDASRPLTLECTVDQNGVTNVTAWSDVRANGFKATAYTDALATAMPHLVSVESSPGSGRYVTALDFGGYSWKTNDYTFLSATPSAAMKYSATKTVKQALTVFADAHGAHQQSVFSNVNAHDFQRNWNTGSLYWNDNEWNKVNIQILKASSLVRNAKTGTWLDGVTASEGMAISEGFHIFDFIGSQKRTESTHDWNVPINAIAMSAGSAAANSSYWGFDYPIAWIDRGGQYVAEQIGFGRMLTTNEQAYLNAYLNYKWLGGANPGSLTTNDEVSISVALGSALSIVMSDGMIVRTSSLAGLGTLTVTDLTVADSLDVTLANGKTECLAVNGTVSFEEALEVNVTADLSYGKIAAGLYPILTATEILNFDASKVTVNVLTERCGIGTAKIVRSGNALYLKTEPKGLMIICR